MVAINAIGLMSERSAGIDPLACVTPSAAELRV